MRIATKVIFSLCLFTLFASVAATRAAALSCPLRTTNPSVTVCQPKSNASYTSPVTVEAGVTDSSPVKLMQIYLDGTKVYEVFANQILTKINVPTTGPHRVTVQAKDSLSRVFWYTVYFNVTASSGGSVSLTPSSVAFSSQPVGSTSPPKTVTLQNGTGSAITISSIAASGDFAQTNSCGSSLSAGASCAISVTFTPTATGTRNGTLSVTDSGAGSPHTAQLSGIGSTPSTGGLSNIKHIIFMLQENRSMDNYFGMMGAYRRARGFNDPFDDLPLGKQMKDANGHLVAPFHFQTVCHENLTPSWNESHYDVDGGLMDRFMQTTGFLHSTIDPDGTHALGYYDWTDLPYYYDLAFNFATSDRYFSSVLSSTIPNRMYMFAATSFGHIYNDAPPSGGWPQPTIFDHLDQAGIKWRYYYMDNSVYLPQWSTWQRDSGKVYPLSQYYIDIKNEATAPQVMFIERGGQTGLDEHPNNNIQKGAARVKQIIDALMASASWPTSVFILSYDEGGGLYDHVPPAAMTAPDNIAPKFHTGDQPGDFAHSGFRVPIIVVSPWTNPHLVSHVAREHSSILKLIETRFNVAPLTARDAAADDMTEFFDFSSPHWLTPPPSVAQPTSGTCDFNLEKAPGH